ncbi:hypothetical protein [Macrococcus armenti]|uniref:Uncharacterized protein n=1 Tax=Macrococcus armenti TaxID=2875764 RepID=A0ABY4A042_9STAP|nr:hypothetical protein [Macrococcus armenti]UOB21431.1 hypothetical protein MRZ06_04930 [Macrococcus armenti]
MVFDKIQVNDSVIEAEGRFRIEDETVKVSTTSEDVGLVFNQIETTNDPVKLVLFKGETDRYASEGLTLKHYTVAGGEFKMELEK